MNYTSSVPHSICFLMSFKNPLAGGMYVRESGSVSMCVL